MSLTLYPLKDFPLIKPGDSLPAILKESLEKNDLILVEGDILILTSKIVSKAENRLVNLTTVQPSSRADHFAKLTGKDPRLLELILSESDEILTMLPLARGIMSLSTSLEHSIGPVRFVAMV